MVPSLVLTQDPFPVTFSEIARGLRAADLAGYAIALHPCGCVYGAAKQLKSSSISSQYPSRDLSTVQSNTQGQVLRIATIVIGQVNQQLPQSKHTFRHKLDHDQGMLLLNLWNSCHCDITISNGFNLENVSTNGKDVKGAVDSSSNPKTSTGGRLEIHLVKPAKLAKKTVASRNKSAIALPLEPPNSPLNKNWKGTFRC
jgi:hypothetical protein